LLNTPKLLGANASPQGELSTPIDASRAKKFPFVFVDIDEAMPHTRDVVVFCRVLQCIGYVDFATDVIDAEGRIPRGQGRIGKRRRFSGPCSVLRCADWPRIAVTRSSGTAVNAKSRG
jgi:hypothetical protein